jgi:hypothetical protein
MAVSSSCAYSISCSGTRRPAGSTSPGRFLFGLINGFFFFLLFGRDRQALFRFLVLMAGAHWAVAVGYTIFVGFDFENLSRLGPRVGGNTNPIPYSFLFISSAGIVVLVLADRMRPDRKYLPWPRSPRFWVPPHSQPRSVAVEDP